PPRTALVAATLALVMPASVYGLAAVPDALAYLLGACALALAAQSDRRAWAFAAGAALARPSAVGLLVGLLLLAATDSGAWPRLRRWPASLVFAAAAGALYAVWFLVGAGSIKSVVRDGLASGGALALGLG